MRRLRAAASHLKAIKPASHLLRTLLRTPVGVARVGEAKSTAQSLARARLRLQRILKQLLQVVERSDGRTGARVRKLKLLSPKLRNLKPSRPSTNSRSIRLRKDARCKDKRKGAITVVRVKLTFQASRNHRAACRKARAIAISVRRKMPSNLSLRPCPRRSLHRDWLLVRN